jgi:arylsulfatase A-like enzyme
MPSSSRPNILYIMSDDHASNAISCYGSRLASVVSTPNIDRLGAEGVRFENAFCTNAICTPSRATILTGLHSHRNGVRTLADSLSHDLQTFPQLLHASGYQTAVVGKWHVHSEPQGFDHYDVLPSQGLYHNPRFLDQTFDWSRYNRVGAEKLGREHEGHVTDVITEKTLNWLRDRDRSRPFLMMCHHKAPHGLWEYQERYEHIFDGVEMPEPSSLWENRDHRSAATRSFGASVSERNPVRNAVHSMSQPGYPTGRLDVRHLDFAGRARAAYQKYLKDYLRTAAGIDDSVGQLLEFLEEDGIAENTVVIYTSDQGMFLGEHDYTDKRWIYEESLRMPLLIRYPAAAREGVVADELITNVDYAPTLLDIAGVAVPESMQGRSFAGVLRGDALDAWPDAMYFRYWQHLKDLDVPAHLGIRTRRYKLVLVYGLGLDATEALNEPTPSGWELYDLKKDPEELRNVFDDPAYRQVRSQLVDRLCELRKSLGDDDRRYPEVAELVETVR